MRIDEWEWGHGVCQHLKCQIGDVGEKGDHPKQRTIFSKQISSLQNSWQPHEQAKKHDMPKVTLIQHKVLAWSAACMRSLLPLMLQIKAGLTCSKLSQHESVHLKCQLQSLQIIPRR